MWVHSMVKLDNTENCLALAGCLRAILELYIDINLMACRKITNDVDKYFYFQDIEKWNMANRIRHVRQDFNLREKGETTPMDVYLAKPGEEGRIEKLKANIWGKNKKERIYHWTGKNIIDRIKLLNDKEIAAIYNTSYYYCNCLVHSTYFDAINDANNIYLYIGHYYNLANEMLFMSSKLVNSIANALPAEDFELRLKEIKEDAFKRCFGEMVKIGRMKSSV